MRFMTYLYERYALPDSGNEFEMIFHYDRSTRETQHITIIDSKSDGSFKSNLDFEGKITELVADLEKQKNVIQGYKMRAGRMRNKITFLESQLDSSIEIEVEEKKHEANRSKEIEANIQ